MLRLILLKMNFDKLFEHTGGLSSFIFGMSLTAAKQRDPPIVDKLNVKNPSVGWLFAFYLATSLVGLFFMTPFRKVGHTN